MASEVNDFINTLPKDACVVVRWENDCFWAVWQVVEPAEGGSAALLRCRANYLDGWFDHLEDPQTTDWVHDARIDGPARDPDVLEMSIRLTGELPCPHL